MYAQLCEQIKPYLQDGLYKNRARKFLAEYRNIMSGPSCLVCGGYGHPGDEMQCGTVTTVILILKREGHHAKAKLFKKKLKLHLLKYNNKVENELKKQLREQENNDESVESMLPGDDSSESSNQKAKKLAKKLRKKSEQAHKMASDCVLDDVVCVQDNILMNTSLIAQEQEYDISNNCKRRRLIKMGDFSDDSRQ